MTLGWAFKVEGQQDICIPQTCLCGGITGESVKKKNVSYWILPSDILA